MEVIGVYPVEFGEVYVERYARWMVDDGASEAELRAACDEYREQVRGTMEGLCLIEAWVPVADGEYDLGGVSQDSPQRPDSQVAYDERWLTDDGAALVDGPENGRARVAFFLHFVDLSKPLHALEGRVELPRAAAMPERLKGLIEYEVPS